MHVAAVCRPVASRPAPRWRLFASACTAAMLAASVMAGIGASSSARAAPQYYIPDVPADMDQVDMSLLTIGLGDDLASRFGHTGLRVINHLDGTDVVFNWGMFSFDDPLFAWRFFRGELDYHMGIATFRSDMRWHGMGKRRVESAALNLTAQQKRALLTKIAWNAKPENRMFRYQYWFKNCATIPRDYLDEALGGKIKERFVASPAGGTKFRDYVRANLAFMPFVAPALELIMNGNIDRPISIWEDMFLPARLRDHLASLPALDDDGHVIPGKMLLGPQEVVLDFPVEYAAPVPDYALLVAPIVLSLLAFVVALVLGRGQVTTGARRALGVGVTYWGIFAGVFGLTLALDWVGSGHPDTWHNANMLLVWPLDFAFIGWGVSLLRGRIVPDRLFGARRGVSLFLGLHALLLLGGVGASLAGVLRQDLSHTGLWLGVPAGLTWLALGLVGVARPQTAYVPVEAEAGGRAGRLSTRRT